jgi:hypothetical protein
LQSKGFYVASDSHANYSISQFSIQSSLNFDYIVPENKANLYAALEMISHSRARTFLEGQGYKFIAFATGYSQSEIADADLYIAPKDYINSFEFMYFVSSALIYKINDFYFPQSRALILNSFERLKEVPEMDPQTPKFIFAHIPAAHVPYVFGPQGVLENPWTLPPAPTDPGLAVAGYIQGYTGQVTYVNELLKDVVDTILAKSSRPPVIIIQGDHGPQTRFHFSFENTCLKERMAILNAYYLPGAGAEVLYPSITPVNSFRVILDVYFHTGLGLLEDRGYLTARDDLSRVDDITQVWNACQAK